MSTALPPAGSASPPAPGGAADPSMEDILASIRRILSEDEGEQAPVSPSPEPQSEAADDVFSLDPSMLVDEVPLALPSPPPAHTQPPALLPPLPREVPPNSAAAALPAAPPPQAPAPANDKPPVGDGLLGPEATAATATAMGSLLRTLVSERQQVTVYRGGPTIEDMVREEIRPLLKLWLDTNLPPIVERLVRSEIERVVGRAVS